MAADQINLTVNLTPEIVIARYTAAKGDALTAEEIASLRAAFIAFWRTHPALRGSDENMLSVPVTINLQGGIDPAE